MLTVLSGLPIVLCRIISEFNFQKGLLIDKCWAEEILSGQKTWEIRSTTLTESALPMIVVLCVGGMKLGEVTFTHSFPLGLFVLMRSQEAISHHRIPLANLALCTYKQPYAWVCASPKIYPGCGIPYTHVPGQNTWVILVE